MAKKLFIFVFVAVVLIHTQFAAADYLLTNGSTTETVRVAYSVWRPASWNWPAGWRTQGWDTIKPRAARTLQVPQDETSVYIRVIGQDGREIKPHDSATRDRFPFWIHPSIAEKSADGDYVYRGESECHPKVSSNLYREYKDNIEAEHFNIEVVQNEILREAEEYTTHKMDELEILTELQHHGGKTNLIDFTTDYLVALFFACDGNRDKSGRVILLQQQSEAYKVVKPPRTIPRVGVQKSIFVQAPNGVVAPDTVTVVCIPVDLKGDILDYLRKHHDISTKTIYSDLLGFIEKRSIHKSAYTEFYKGFTCQNRADAAKNREEKQGGYDKAIERYTEAIELNPELAIAYYNRGVAYNDKDEFDLAIQDYTTAIELNPEHANAYNNRGEAWLHLREWEKAKADIITAKNMGVDIVASFHNDYESIEAFEAKRGVKVPEDIAVLLRRD